MTRTFRKTLKDHAGPGLDVVREFYIATMPGCGVVKQFEDGKMTGMLRTDELNAHNWVRDLLKGGFEEVQSPANNLPTSGEKSG